MRFDDRLRTVLAQPAREPHDRAVRWRQLVELAARAGPDGDGGLLQQAIDAIREDSGQVDERVRVAAALAIASLNLPAGLVAAFAADRLNVAAPIFAGARLSASEWKQVAAEASDECRDFISTMGFGKPRPDGGPSAPAEPPPGEKPKPIPSISDVVARIERIRHSRESGNEQPALDEDASGTARLFRWECNEAGEIDWVEGAPRGAFVGHSIAQRGIAGGVDLRVERAFASRAPFHDGVLELPSDVPVGGTWKISGVPAFDRSSGRFSGYRGIAERPAEGQQGGSGMPADSASLRELAHEIRTPLNAIIGFAEIISGEHLGPAESRYRERAAEIVAHARALLSAVEDLDFAAKLRSGDRHTQADLADCLARAWDKVEQEASARGVPIYVTAAEQPARCRVDAELAERLLERLAIAVIGFANTGDRLTFHVGADCTVTVNRPPSLEQVDLQPDRNRRSADSATLPVRLVMGLARTAGGDLDVSGDSLVLRLPVA